MTLCSIHSGGVLLVDLEVIKKEVSKLPLSTIGRVALRHETWEADDGLAHFQVNRYPVGNVPNYIITYMLIYGMESDRRRIIKEFSMVLGKPDFQIELYEESPNTADSVTWVSERD